MEAPPPVAPPKKNTVIGVAVIVPTNAMIIPEITNFQTFVDVYKRQRRYNGRG